MADEKVVNGVASDGDDHTAENFYDLDQRENEAKVTELTRKIEALEHEKLELMRENEVTKERIKRLTIEIDEIKGNEVEAKERLGEMEREREMADEQILESIAARAVELETEVSRLQHDLITAMSEVQEASAEIVELKRVLGEKGVRIENLEREVEGLKKEKAESEKKVRELERKIGVLEVREIEERSKKVRIEEEMRERIDEKESEISGFKKKVEDLESEVMKNGMELEKWKLEKKGVEEALRKSEEKGRAMEGKIMQLKKEVEEAEKVISGLKEKTVEAVNGMAAEITASIEGEEKGLKLQWPVVAAGSTGAIAVAAVVVYVCYGRRS